MVNFVDVDVLPDHNIGYYDGSGTALIARYYADGKPVSNGFQEYVKWHEWFHAQDGSLTDADIMIKLIPVAQISGFMGELRMINACAYVMAKRGFQNRDAYNFMEMAYRYKDHPFVYESELLGEYLDKSGIFDRSFNSMSSEYRSECINGFNGFRFYKN